MNLQANQKGFTIVELLIVIVVIAILAAISIVAYTGIQNNARNSAAAQTASQVAGKANAYHATNGYYPSNVAAFADEEVARLEGLTVSDHTTGAFAVPTTPTETVNQWTAGTRVYYQATTSSGASNPDGYVIYHRDSSATNNIGTITRNQ